MTNYAVKNVDEFISAAPQEAQSHLKEIREIVKATIPQAEEKIGYGKPYYKLERWLVGFDIYKQHVGFEIWEGQLPDDLRSDLEAEGYKTGNKTFQIQYTQRVPKTLLIKLIKAQATLSQEIAASKKK